MAVKCMLTRGLFLEFTLLQNTIAYRARICDADYHHVVRRRARVLYRDCAEIQECLYEPILLDRDVLHCCERKRRHFAIKKPCLVHGNKPLFCDEPEVEIVVGPDDGKCKPHNKHPPKSDERD